MNEINPQPSRTSFSIVHTRRVRRRSPAALMAAVATLTFGACTAGTGDEPDPLDDFDRVAMLENLADTVIMPTYDAFATDAQAFGAAADAYQSAPDDTQARTDAQAAFRAAALSWERAEVMQVGPAASFREDRPGGRDLRDEIYSWYQGQNPCAVDQALVAQEYDDEGFFAAQLLPKKGFDAMEYALFHDGEDNACAATATINTSGSWAALSPSELQSRRAGFVAAAAAYLIQCAHELQSAWKPSEGNFRAEFITDGNTYANPVEAMDALFAAMFYVELRAKDRKLAVPLGLHMDCAQAAGCPEDEEFHRAGLSTAALAANFIAFRDLFTGGDGAGFDDALDAVDASELKTRMADNLDNVIAMLANEERTVSTLVETDHDTARAIHDAIKLFTDDLKSQFVSVLNLSVPQEGAGDND